MSKITQEKLEIYADPGKSAVSLIYDLKGNVIGNSQALARDCLKLSKAMETFGTDMENAIKKMCDSLEVE